MELFPVLRTEVVTVMVRIVALSTRCLTHQHLAIPSNTLCRLTSLMYSGSERPFALAGGHLAQISSKETSSKCTSRPDTIVFVNSQAISVCFAPMILQKSVGHMTEENG